MSSTKDIDFASPFIAIDRPSAASRTCQIACCAAGSMRAMAATVESARAEIVLERIEPRRQVVGAIAVELDAEQRGRFAVHERLPESMQIGALPGVIEDEGVHHLDRRGRCARIAGVAASASSRSAN